MKSDYLVLFAGGTGGHVIPAVNYGMQVSLKEEFCVSAPPIFPGIHYIN